MIDIYINNQRWHCPTQWKEVSLGQAMRLETLIDAAPAEIRGHFATAFDPSAEESGLDATENQPLQEFYARTLAILGNIPEEICLRTVPEQVAEFVDHYLSLFVVSLIFEPVFEPEHPDGFEWRGERLLLPRSGVDVAGKELPCAGLSAEEFCNASELYTADRIRYAAAIIATLCRPEGEAYDEQCALRRAQGMEMLDMQTVLEVFFCLQEHINT